MLRTAMFLMCFVALSTGCTAPKIETRVVDRVTVVRPKVPPQLTECADAPLRPVIGTQADVAEYILKLFGAHADCKARLQSLNAILAEE